MEGDIQQCNPKEPVRQLSIESLRCGWELFGPSTDFSRPHSPPPPPTPPGSRAPRGRLLRAYWAPNAVILLLRHRVYHSKAWPQMEAAVGCIHKGHSLLTARASS